MNSEGSKGLGAKSEKFSLLFALDPLQGLIFILASSAAARAIYGACQAVDSKKCNCRKSAESAKRSSSCFGIFEVL
jgi:hypothetical protein